MHKQKQQNSHHIRDVAPMQPYAAVPASSMPTPAITSKHSSGHSKSAALLAKQSQDLERALTQAKADELALFKSLGDTIDAQRATIPLQFLFERNMSAYCIQKGVETILHVFSTLQLLALEANGRENLWTIREHAEKIRERRAYEARTREEAAVRIHIAYRGHRSRVIVERLQRVVADAVAAAVAIKHAALLRLRNNSTLIQSIIRMFLVRLRLYNKRMQDAIRADNALTIQVDIL
ncbi:hypothetical protein DYB37_010595 [Aphanomyces astaci]|uniref:Uncharacterized protein n=1 Tax=Aphanomyces astaci TaxID=112090 RepID=A0A3R6Y6R8_APHAT|nr:hypothetical protein DYB35_010246 [Aphanomyces astaci]RHZ14615.1 hypothetical protein DYB37_010595 [Aphanomyces astaci]